MTTAFQEQQINNTLTKILKWNHLHLLEHLNISNSKEQSLEKGITIPAISKVL